MKELLEKYPKAAKVVKDYYLELFMKGLEGKDFDEDYLEHVRSQEPQLGILENILEENPIGLSRIFDANHIYISTSIKINSEGVFFVCGINEAITATYFDRISAEKEAVSKAFEILESKLSHHGIS